MGVACQEAATKLLNFIDLTNQVSLVTHDYVHVTTMAVLSLSVPVLGSCCRVYSLFHFVIVIIIMPSVTPLCTSCVQFSQSCTELSIIIL